MEYTTFDAVIPEQTGNASKAIDEFMKTLEYEDSNEDVFIKNQNIKSKLQVKKKVMCLTRSLSRPRTAMEMTLTMTSTDL